jgi:CRISPR-associated endonuclease/helicase Cas3
MNDFPTFPEFFEHLYGYSPFPWQRMLAERVAEAEANWPDAIDLPTASGKTACIDVAIWALANQANLDFGERTAPRRIWFVVDRRIVVDEAFERAKNIAEKLIAAGDGPLKIVADRLRRLGGLERPLAVGKLRGGIIQEDDGWARIPSQPAILTSTVDQLGSRLLFRGYGFTDSKAPIHAGLAGNDSLIILDEAHCSAPFFQTLRAVKSFRASKWADEHLPTPFQFTVMSATLGDANSDQALDKFPDATNRLEALDHEILRRRSEASKQAQLIEVSKAKKGEKPSSNNNLVLRAAEEAIGFARTGKQRIAVMVNRVATAEAIHQHLKQDVGDDAEVVLLTGRMRPHDGRKVIADWSRSLRAGKETEELELPIIMVTTQCLEVGADYCFDALVTECASLDALRQRFGRLDRLGNLKVSPAVILARTEDVKEVRGYEDSIYGHALAKTWQWLWKRSSEGGEPIDFGIAAMDTRLRDFPAEGLFAKSEDAPILLPAHLDMLCQTSPEPDPQPDIDLFLHGKGRKSAEVSVIWRADLTRSKSDELQDFEDNWIEAVALVPPLSAEALSVPLHRLKKWLEDQTSKDTSGDVEGELDSANGGGGKHAQPFLIWRGRKKAKRNRGQKPQWESVVGWNPEDIKRGDRVVLPTEAFGIEGLGQAAEREGLGAVGLDLAELAGTELRKEHVLRLTPSTLAPWRDRLAVRALFALLEETENAPDHEDLCEALDQLLNEPAAEITNDENPPKPLPSWLTTTLTVMLESKTKIRVSVHPCGSGIILSAKKPNQDAIEKDELFADEDDLASRLSTDEPLSLAQHAADVAKAAELFAQNCLPESFRQTYHFAAVTHDLGKLDRRFQMLLHNGDESACEAALANAEPLAKSEKLSKSRAQTVRLRERIGLPEGFRHEALSWQLLDHLETPGTVDGTLAAHLVSSHHGHGRPFHPVAVDEEPPEVDLNMIGLPLRLDGKTHAERPAYRLGSGIAENFWRLNRRFGWWGLAHLESLFRLADWYASANPGCAEKARAKTVFDDLKPAQPEKRARHTAAETREIVLTGIDGANPLGFLAALGALRILNRAEPVRMKWTEASGGWRPVVSGPLPEDGNALAQLLFNNVSHFSDLFPAELLVEAPKYGPSNKKGELSWKDKLLFELGCYRRHLTAVISNSNGNLRLAIDCLAAWAGETCTKEVNKVNVAERTRFDFTAGQQAFVGMVRDVRRAVSVEDIQHTLFGPWIYRNDATSMRWDPLDEKRQYAVQAFDPTNASANPSIAELGANYLAVEGLGFYAFAADRDANQPGFSGKGDHRNFAWPIWTEASALAEVQSILWLDGDKSADAAEYIGVAQTLCSAIVMPSGRYRCFTPSRAPLAAGPGDLSKLQQP